MGVDPTASRTFATTSYGDGSEDEPVEPAQQNDAIIEESTLEAEGGGHAHDPPALLAVVVTSEEGNNNNNANEGFSNERREEESQQQNVADRMRRLVDLGEYMDGPALRAEMKRLAKELDEEDLDKRRSIVHAANGVDHTKGLHSFPREKFALSSSPSRHGPNASHAKGLYHFPRDKFRTRNRSASTDDVSTVVPDGNNQNTTSSQTPDQDQEEARSSQRPEGQQRQTEATTDTGNPSLSLIEAVLVEQGNSQPREAPQVAVEARAVRLKDMLGICRLELFIFGLICLVSAIIVAVLLIIIYASGDDSDSDSSATATKHPIFGLDPEILSDIPDYSQAAIQVSSSSQSKAYSWLALHPQLETLENRRRKQLFALATFCYAFECEDWPEELQRGWLSHSDPECSWAGIACSNQEEEITEIRIISLNAALNKGITGYVSGTMPPELSLLTSLQAIEMFSAQFHATVEEIIPTQMEELTKLRQLKMPGNSIQGHIPTYIGQTLAKLTYLDHGMNYLGTIPTEIGQLQSLEKLKMYMSNLRGTIPSEIGCLLNLTDINLRMNKLSGTVPTEIGLLSGSFLLK